MNEGRIAGVDYGSNLAGTTSISYENGGNIFVLQSYKGQSADEWLKQVINKECIQHIFIDAPLSLPNGYFGIGQEFFFRKCDRELKAMSPMFLGGLTARAMQINFHFNSMQVQCTEVYPRGFIKSEEKFIPWYNKKDKNSISMLVDRLSEILPYSIETNINSYHQLDSLICLYIGYKYSQGKATNFGDEAEGFIWI